MLIRVDVSVEHVGEIYEIVELHAARRLGPVISALLEELARKHPGVGMLDHKITVTTRPSTAQEATGPVLIR